MKSTIKMRTDFMCISIIPLSIKLDKRQIIFTDNFCNLIFHIFKITFQVRTIRLFLEERSRTSMIIGCPIRMIPIYIGIISPQNQSVPIASILQFTQDINFTGCIFHIIVRIIRKPNGKAVVVL